nr:hypothetical protein [Pseudomonas brassicae]
MRQSLSDAIVSLEPLTKEAIEALRRYHEAQNAGAASDEVERLRLLAESLFQTVSAYQASLLGAPIPSRH